MKQTWIAVVAIIVIVVAVIIIWKTAVKPGAKGQPVGPEQMMSPQDYERGMKAGQQPGAAGGPGGAPGPGAGQ